MEAKLISVSTGLQIKDWISFWLLVGSNRDSKGKKAREKEIIKKNYFARLVDFITVCVRENVALRKCLYGIKGEDFYASIFREVPRREETLWEHRRDRVRNASAFSMI